MLRLGFFVAGCVAWCTANVALIGCGETTFDLDAGDRSGLGKAYADARDCAKCHQGSGGTLAGQLTPRPGTESYGSNLTPDHATGIGDLADIALARAIRDGVDNASQPLCPSMPHYGLAAPMQSEMTDLEAYAIVAYLRSLPPVVQAIPASRCPPLKPPPALDLSVPPPPVDGGLID